MEFAQVDGDIHSIGRWRSTYWHEQRSRTNRPPLTVVNMARRSGTSTRARALARAAEAVARRDAERIEREKSLQAALADLYQAQAEVERIHNTAAAAAVPFELAIRDAVRALDELDETRAGIAVLTGLSTARVREYLAVPQGEPCRPVE
jgi:hypothetical protein